MEIHGGQAEGVWVYWVCSGLWTEGGLRTEGTALFYFQFLVFSFSSTGMDVRCPPEQSRTFYEQSLPDIEKQVISPL